MPPHIFNFELQPLAEIQAWGEPHDPSLSWFGLTLNAYWIQVGSERLFGYSASAQAELGATRFCNYQVARIYEDLLQLKPHALEPVPTELQQYISVAESRPWNLNWEQWCAAGDTQIGAVQVNDLLDIAGPWMGRRPLHSLYLKPSTNIAFWSDAELVHIEWDIREKLVKDEPAWSAPFGRWALPHMEFISEVRSFHERLMAEMATRISQIAGGCLSSRIRVDLDAFHHDQNVRTWPIEPYLGPIEPPTNWSAVIDAILMLEAYRNS